MKKYLYFTLLTLAISLATSNLQAMEKENSDEIKAAQKFIDGWEIPDKISALNSFTTLVTKEVGYAQAIAAAQNGIVHGILSQNKELITLAIKLYEILVNKIDIEEKMKKLKYIQRLLKKVPTQNIDTPCIDKLSRIADELKEKAPKNT